MFLGRYRRVPRVMRNMRASGEPWTEGKLEHLVSPWPGTTVPHRGNKRVKKAMGLPKKHLRPGRWSREAGRKSFTRTSPCGHQVALEGGAENMPHRRAPC